MTPFYSRDNITIFCGDCLEVMPQLDNVDTIITDPPYGIGFDTNYTRFSFGVSEAKNWHEPIIGDDEPFDPAHLLDYRRVIIWGANNYSDRLPPAALLVWDKRFRGNSKGVMSDAEVAWFNHGRGVYIFQHAWDGFIRDSERQTAFHPTQKPAALFRWCIKKAEPQGLILDPYMGSGSLLVAAQQLGRRATGIEISEAYCAVAVERLRQRSLWQIVPLERVEARQGELL